MNPPDGSCADDGGDSRDATARPHVSLREALAFWFKLGFISFGGPAGQIALMHEHVVERARWISEKRFLHALNYCMLLPGPEAQQLATYLGWLMHRSVGGIAAGMLFILPSFLLIALIAWAYLIYGHLPWVSGLLDGIKPAVVALVLAAGWRMGGRTLRTRPLAAIALGAFVSLDVFNLPFPLVIGAAALLGLLFQPAGAAAAHGPPQAPSGARAGAQASPQTDAQTVPQTGPHAVPGPVTHELTGSPSHAAESRARIIIDDDTPPPEHARLRATRLFTLVIAGLALWAAGWALCRAIVPGNDLLPDMAGFFTRAALLTFGGAYAVLPYVHQAAVEHYQWLTAAQMLDGLALGETTPGPLIMIVTFVGFIGGFTREIFGADQAAAAGWAAATAATFFTFLPSFIFILVGGPLVESTRSLPRLDRALSAITAAVVGVIASLAFTLAQTVLWRAELGTPDWYACAATVLATWLLIVRRTSVIATIALFGAAGVALSLSGMR